jgi:preprotein translocase subunit SecA
MPHTIKMPILLRRTIALLLIPCLLAPSASAAHSAPVAAKTSRQIELNTQALAGRSLAMLHGVGNSRPMVTLRVAVRLLWEAIDSNAAGISLGQILLIATGLAVVFIEPLGGSIAGAHLAAAPFIVGIRRSRVDWAREVEIKQREFARLRPAALAEKSRQLRQHRQAGEPLEAIVVEALALFAEATRITLEDQLSHEQLLAALALLLDVPAAVEQPSGEGKSLSLAAAAYVRSLEGQGVHIHTFNRYLARRDAATATKIFGRLNVSVGVLDQGQYAERRAAFSRDITYGDADDFITSHLEDELESDPGKRRQRSRGPAAIYVDEADPRLIDEAVDPVILSSPSSERLPVPYLNQLYEVTRRLLRKADFDFSRAQGTVTLTEQGREAIRSAAAQRGWPMSGEDLFDHAQEALAARLLYERNKNYVVMNEAVQLLNPTTHRLRDHAVWEGQLTNFVAIKERAAGKKVRLIATPLPHNLITRQDYYAAHQNVLGVISATLAEAEEELETIYGLKLVVIRRTHRTQREDYPLRLFVHQDQARDAVLRAVSRWHERGNPVLTVSMDMDEAYRYSAALRPKIPHVRTLTVFEEATEESLIKEIGGQAGAVTNASGMAGRGTDLRTHGRELICIGTEVPLTAREERQIRGRAGRWTDPGQSFFYGSLENPLFRDYLSESTRDMLVQAAKPGGEIPPALVQNALTEARAFSESYRRSSRHIARLRGKLLDDHRQRFFQRLTAGLPAQTQQQLRGLWLVYLQEVQLLRRRLPIADYIKQSADRFQRLIEAAEDLQAAWKANPSTTRQRRQLELERRAALSARSESVGQRIERLISQSWRSSDLEAVAAELQIPMNRLQLAQFRRPNKRPVSLDLITMAEQVLVLAESRPAPQQHVLALRKQRQEERRAKAEARTIREEEAKREREARQEAQRRQAEEAEERRRARAVLEDQARAVEEQLGPLRAAFQQLTEQKLWTPPEMFQEMKGVTEDVLPRRAFYAFLRGASLSPAAIPALVDASRDLLTKTSKTMRAQEQFARRTQLRTVEVYGQLVRAAAARSRSSRRLLRIARMLAERARNDSSVTEVRRIVASGISDDDLEPILLEKFPSIFADGMETPETPAIPALRVKAPTVTTKEITRRSPRRSQQRPSAVVHEADTTPRPDVVELDRMRATLQRNVIWPELDDSHKVRAGQRYVALQSVLPQLFAAYLPAYDEMAEATYVSGRYLFKEQPAFLELTVLRRKPGGVPVETLVFELPSALRKALGVESLRILSVGNDFESAVEYYSGILVLGADRLRQPGTPAVFAAAKQLVSRLHDGSNLALAVRLVQSLDLMQDVPVMEIQQFWEMENLPVHMQMSREVRERISRLRHRIIYAEQARAGEDVPELHVPAAKGEILQVLEQAAQESPVPRSRNVLSRLAYALESARAGVNHVEIFAALIKSDAPIRNVRDLVNRHIPRMITLLALLIWLPGLSSAETTATLTAPLETWAALASVALASALATAVTRNSADRARIRTAA